MVLMLLLLLMEASSHLCPTLNTRPKHGPPGMNDLFFKTLTLLSLLSFGDYSSVH